ncbi:MAG: HAD-IA family hydrolase [Caulobacteraceae bacterium]|nr:HAD-IA family hydrolase [Caulobacteraceae bacterium]
MALTGAAIAFDLDGTLVETAPDLIGALNAVLSERRLPALPLASARHLVGLGARVMLEHGFREAGATYDAGDMPLLVDRFVEIYRGRIAEQSRPFPGVEAALNQLAAEGAVLVVATNKRTDLSLELLERLGLLDRFAAVVGPDAVTRRKPDPAHLVEAVRKAGGDPGRALMVGDSMNDVLPARAAGMPVVAVSFGYTETPAADLGADALIEHFDQLPAVARKLLT